MDYDGHKLQVFYRLSLLTCPGSSDSKHGYCLGLRLREEGCSRVIKPSVYCLEPVQTPRCCRQFFCPHLLLPPAKGTVFHAGCWWELPLVGKHWLMGHSFTQHIFIGSKGNQGGTRNTVRAFLVLHLTPTREKEKGESPSHSEHRLLPLPNLLPLPRS